VWAGGFRDGIDVLTAAGQRLAHLESDSNREINSLAEDPKTHLMLAATSQGLLSFDTNLRYSNRWSTAEGLLSKSVLHVARMQGDATDTTLLACATSKGLSLGTAGKLRSLTTVQGLPSNSLYTVLAQGRNLYAGTLSGLAVTQDGRVVRVFKDSNSNLSTNWVTALCVVGSRIFVGTYGGGIFELTPAGELAALNPGNGRVVINPNAMWSDGTRLYAGTLNGALMFDLQSQQWTRITAELPSRTVLSVSGDGQYVYFGTTAGIARIERSYWDEGSTSRG
jgi:ligand-binding sensor domain-containing protein